MDSATGDTISLQPLTTLNPLSRSSSKEKAEAKGNISNLTKSKSEISFDVTEFTPSFGKKRSNKGRKSGEIKEETITLDRLTLAFNDKEYVYCNWDPIFVCKIASR